MEKYSRLELELQEGEKVYFAYPDSKGSFTMKMLIDGESLTNFYASHDSALDDLEGLRGELGYEDYLENPPKHKRGNGLVSIG